MKVFPYLVFSLIFCQFCYSQSTYISNLIKSQRNFSLPFVYKPRDLKKFEVSIDSLNKYCENIKLNKKQIQNIEGLAIINIVKPDSFKMVLIRFDDKKKPIQSFNYILYLVNKNNEIDDAKIIYNNYIRKLPLDYLTIHKNYNVEISKKIEYIIKFLDKRAFFE